MTNSIRKAAILISTLETRAADAVLDQMLPEQAARVRQAIMDLDEIPQDEQDQVIAEFLRGGGKLPAASDEGVELDVSLAQRLEQGNFAESEPLAVAYADQQPFHFLHDADAKIVADVLRQEHPQTIAAVLAHLPAEKAAALLENLPASLSTAALERMAWLGELQADVLRDLEQQLRAVLLPRLESAKARPAALAGLSAVLSALSGRHRSEAIRQLATRDERLVRQLGYMSPSAEAMPPTASSEPKVVAFRYPVPPPQSDDLDFADLAELSDADLKQVFAVADPDVALLALTGADERFTRRILRQLPTRHATLLRQKLNHPGPLRLRDLEAAQQELARIASDLATRGHIHLTTHRPFAAAA